MKEAYSQGGESNPRPLKWVLTVLMISIISVIMPGTGLLLCLGLFYFIKRLKKQYQSSPQSYTEKSMTMLRAANILTWIGLIMGVAAAITAFFTGLAATVFVFFMMLAGHKVGGWFFLAL